MTVWYADRAIVQIFRAIEFKRDIIKCRKLLKPLVFRGSEGLPSLFPALQISQPGRKVARFPSA